MTTIAEEPDDFDPDYEDRIADEKSDWAKIPRTPASQGSLTPTGWEPTHQKPVPVIQCTAFNNKGERCGRWSIRGHRVCIKHGGRLPNVQKHAAAVVEAARLRLIDMADPAIDVLHDLIQSGTADAIRLGAAKEILDRAGVRGGIDVTMEVEHKIDPAALVADRLAQIRKNQQDNDEVIAVVLEEVGGDDDGGVVPGDDV